jgi:PEGA domain-containing protein
MKKLLNEVLPDPKQAERDLKTGSPRDRTTAHLRRIVAAAAALQLGTAVADNSVPGDKGKDGNKPPEAQKPPEKPPEPPGYLVVDPVPPPYINRNEGEGWLRIESKPPGAEVLVDGEVAGKTPLKYKVAPGSHAVTAQLAGGPTANVTVDVKKGKTVKHMFDLRAKKK